MTSHAHAHPRKAPRLAVRQRDDLVQIVAQNAANQQRSRNEQQIPPARKRVALPPSDLQRRKQAEKRREDLRHIVQIPQITGHMVVFKKAILDRAQEHPHNGHRAAQQQILPDIFDVDQVGQHETGGRRQRGDVLIELPKDTGEDEQAHCETEFHHGFSSDGVHSFTSSACVVNTITVPYK